MNICFAGTEDATDLLKIYEQSIASPITFEEELPSLTEFENRIREITATYPYLIAKEKGKTIGYAYAHRFRERAAYQWSAELSIYIDKEAQSKGVGTRLYTVLIGLLKLQGIQMLYSGVTVPNEKSRRLHLHMGFTPVGVYHRAGFKCGGWRDVEWFELDLYKGKESQMNNRGSLPSLVCPVSSLPKKAIESLLIG